MTRVRCGVCSPANGRVWPEENLEARLSICSSAFTAFNAESVLLCHLQALKY
jgi:hypothetical protein